MTHDARSCAHEASSSSCAIRVPLRFTGMPQRSLASLVLGPILIGVLCLALACVAGERTDRLGDTLRVSDTLHVADTPRVADSVSAAADTASAAADSAAASQIAVSVDSSAIKAADSSARQQGTTGKPAQGGSGGSRSSCCESGSRVHRHAVRALSPLAEDIANSLVFVPRDRTWFTVASRGRRMLVDIGRIDIPIKRDSVTWSAYLEAVSRLSPLPMGTVLRLRGPYSIVEEARVKGFDVWNGRIVARVEVSKTLDSLARTEDMLPATAVRRDSATAASTTTPADTAQPGVVKTDSVRGPIPPPPACVRDTLPTELAARGIAVRDSIARFLVDSVQAPYERMATESKVYSWWTPGCFGISRLLVVANRRTSDMEFAVERAVLVDSTGKVLPVRFSDLRFHAHDPLYVFDADGDGIDDLAARGYGDRSGGLTIMRLDVATRRFLRLASGFAWER
jgi:hypothetical protein